MCEDGKYVKVKPSEYKKQLKKLVDRGKIKEFMEKYPDMTIELFAKRCELSIDETKKLIGK